jgi:GNAT superfamily N-acetyltransferase
MRAAIRALPPGIHPARTLAAWSSLPPLYHRWAMGPGGEVYLVAARAGRVLGYAALRDDELTAVFVRPRAQGAGVGRTLVRAAAARARRAGARSLRVLAARAAVDFYAALGFRGAARTRVPLPGRVALDSVRMRLELER